MSWKCRGAVSSDFWSDCMDWERKRDMSVFFVFLTILYGYKSIRVSLPLTAENHSIPFFVQIIWSSFLAGEVQRSQTWHMEIYLVPTPSPWQPFPQHGKPCVQVTHLIMIARFALLIHSIVACVQILRLSYPEDVQPISMCMFVCVCVCVCVCACINT